jgi:hypothetical protein
VDNNFTDINALGNEYICSSANGTISLSATGTTWTKASGLYALGIKTIAVGPQICVMGAAVNNLIVGTKGNWQTIPFNPPLKPGNNIDQVSKVIWADSQFIAVSTTGNILTSKNGTSWNFLMNDTTLGFQDITTGGGYTIVVGALHANRAARILITPPPVVTGIANGTQKSITKKTATTVRISNSGLTYAIKNAQASPKAVSANGRCTRKNPEYFGSH